MPDSLSLNRLSAPADITIPGENTAILSLFLGNKIKSPDTLGFALPGLPSHLRARSCKPGCPDTGALYKNGHKKQAPPLRAGLIDTAGDCNLTPAAALRTNPKDLAHFCADGSRIFQKFVFVNTLRKERGFYAVGNAIHVFRRNHPVGVNPSPAGILAKSRNNKPVKGNGIHHIAFYPMFGGVVWERQSVGHAQQIMPFLLIGRRRCAHRDNDTQSVRYAGKHNHRPLFVHFRRNTAMKITKKDCSECRIISNCHGLNRLSAVSDFTSNINNAMQAKKPTLCEFVTIAPSAGFPRRFCILFTPVLIVTEAILQ